MIFSDLTPYSLIYRKVLPSILYTKLKMEAAGCSETFVSIYKITGCHIPEDIIFTAVRTSDLMNDKRCINSLKGL
jgi:hypothetical protein